MYTFRGNVSTYKELCSLASDLNKPDLVYKFMHLVNHHALWNSKKVCCLFVCLFVCLFSSILSSLKHAHFDFLSCLHEDHSYSNRPHPYYIELYIMDLKKKNSFKFFKAYRN